MMEGCCENLNKRERKHLGKRGRAEKVYQTDNVSSLAKLKIQHECIMDPNNRTKLCKMYKPTTKMKCSKSEQAINYSDDDQTIRMNAFDGERTSLLLLVNEKQKCFISKKKGMNKVDFSVKSHPTRCAMYVSLSTSGGHK